MSLSIQTNFRSKVFYGFVLATLGFSVILLLSCFHSQAQNRSVKFVVRLKKDAIGQKVYLTGNTDQLGNWSASAVLMTRQSDSLWSATLSFQDGEKIEYKVTAGSWWTEALNQNRATNNNFRLKVESDTTVYIDVYDWLNKMANGRPIFGTKRFQQKRPYVTLDGLWRYHTGDNTEWASPQYDDSSWVVTDPYIEWNQPSDPQWNGIGWFRFHLYMDSTLWNRTLAIRINQTGASEIYYDGKLLYFFGKIGSSVAATQPRGMSGWQSIEIDPQYNQLIAVRYANYDWKNLLRLNNVKQLSEKTIEQERVTHKLELERQAIELENDRKNRELESARELQLSLLPKEVPQLNGLDIAAFMKTATEVGGDYYDFFVSENGTLLAVLGDATRHCLKAGNMMTETKGLLNILSESGMVEDILISANQAIKKMDLYMLTMCLAVARIDKNALQYSSAGMPPLIVYKAQTGQCEQHVLKAMPLGAVTHFPYKRTSFSITAGDVVLMTSDGLHEMFDERREMYGIENIMESLKKHAQEPAEEVIRGLFKDGQTWAGNRPLADDLTIVVIKATDGRFD